MIIALVVYNALCSVVVALPGNPAFHSLHPDDHTRQTTGTQAMGHHCATHHRPKKSGVSI